METIINKVAAGNQKARQLEAGGMCSLSVYLIKFMFLKDKIRFSCSGKTDFLIIGTRL